MTKHFVHKHLLPEAAQQQMVTALAAIPAIKDAAGMKSHIERIKQTKHRAVAGIAIQNGFQCLACGVSATSQNSMRQHKSCGGGFECSKVQKLTSLKNGFVFSVDVANETGPKFDCFCFYSPERKESPLWSWMTRL
jgi:hypothetical protein